MNTGELGAASSPLLNVLDRLGVRWYVGGSVASSLLGLARSTLDLDLVAEIEAEHAAELAASLREGYYVEESMIREAVGRHTSFSVIHLETMIKIDVFVAGREAWSQQAMSRRVRDSLDVNEGAREVWVASAEDVILSKLAWYRTGGETSERQWNDILGVLRVQADSLDRGYLAHWADELGVADLLARAILAA